MVQTVINNNLPIAFAGMLADSSDNTINSYTVVNEANGVPFGSFVVRDSVNERLAKLPSVLTDITAQATRLGFALHSHANEQEMIGSVNQGYKNNSTMSVIRKGAVYVVVENAVVAGGSVFVRAIATGNEKRGAVRADADGTDAAIVPSATFRTGASAGGFAIVEINLP